MTKPGVYFIVDLAIADGKLEAFQTIAQSMVEGTEQEPGALAYEFYLDSNQKQCRLIEIYSDSDAALADIDRVEERAPLPPGAVARPLGAGEAHQVGTTGQGVGPAERKPAHVANVE